MVLHLSVRLWPCADGNVEALFGRVDGTSPNWRAACEKLPASAVATNALRLSSASIIQRDLRKVTI